MNYFKNVLLVLGLSTTLFINGCGFLDQKTPSKVVFVSYMSANDGNYSEANKYFSLEVEKLFEGSYGALVGGKIGMWNKVTRNGTIAKIDNIKEIVRGEGATVTFKIIFKNGREKTVNEMLIKENGQWKIALGGY